MIARLVCLFVLTAAAAAPPALLPLVREPAPGVPEVLPRLRGQQSVWLHAPEVGVTLRVGVRFKQIGQYDVPVSAQIAGHPETKVTVGLAAAGLPREAELVYTAAEAGAVEVEVDTDRNALELIPTAASPWLTLRATPEQAPHLISQTGRLWFYVPAGTPRFSVFGAGGGPNEPLKLTVFNPAGEPVATASTPDRTAVEAPVTVPAGQSGKVWSATAGKLDEMAAGLTFEDHRLWLSPEVPQVFALRPDGLLVPFAQGLRRRPELRRDAMSLDFGVNVETGADDRLEVTLRQGDHVLATAAGTPPAPVRLALPDTLSPGEYELTAELHSDGRLRGLDRSTLLLTESLVFVGGVQALVAAELRTRPEKLPLLVVAPNLGGQLPGLAGTATLSRTDFHLPPGDPAAEDVATREVADLSVVQEIEPPATLPDGHYQWRVNATAGGRAVEVSYANFVLAGGELLSEVDVPPAMPLPAVTETDRRRGLIAFVPKVVDGLAYNARPEASTRERPVVIRATPGESEPGTFGLWSPAGASDVRVSAAALRGPGGTIGADAVDLRVVRHWPQRRSWNSPTYWIVPELLETPAPFDLAAAGLRQIWLTVRVPENQQPGLYRGTVTVQADGAEPFEQAVELEVLPFRLVDPPAAHWGLWPDTGRWREWSEAKTLATLRDIRAHGVTSLMLYPVYHSTIERVDGTLRIDSSELEQQVELARSAGLGPPWVISLQALPGVVQRLAPGAAPDSAEYRELWQAITDHFVELAERKGWGRCVWHAVDEPWNDETHAAAIRLLTYFKDRGLETYTTAGRMSPELDAVLDVRCYSNGWSLRNPRQLADVKAETAASGDEFWYYGSGSYTGQEGNLAANRWLCGPLFWLSGATGEWSWTFCRPKQQAFNDFDGQGQREEKDAMIVYPSEGDAAPIPTLQWEAMREGVDDYRYLATLRASQDPGAKLLLSQIEEEIRAGWVNQSVDANVLSHWRDSMIDQLRRESLARGAG